MCESNDLRREVDFLLSWPIGANQTNATIHGYIDALYLDPSGAWRLVDYKTNQVSERGVPDLAEQYRLQLSVYALAVEQALGVAPESLTLCFLRPGVEYDLSWDADDRERANRQVTDAIEDARQSAVSDLIPQ